MRKTLSLLFLSIVTVSLLAGCSSSTTSTGLTTSPATVPVSISMTDDPPAGVSVLFFQVSLTNASLTPASGSAVSLLSNNTPIEIDVTQLQTLSAFLSTANLTPGPYKSLSLTFASPELVIFNASDTSIAGTCAVGSVCQIAPAIDDNSATVNFTTSPFPVTVAANSPLGFLVDFHLNTVIQPDLSVNLGVANGITIAQLPQVPTTPQLGNLTGTVQSVTAASNLFTLQTQWGRSFAIDAAGATFSDFPTSVCTTQGIACLSGGQVVQVKISGVETGGNLSASQVTYLQAASQQTAEGTIVAIPPLPLPPGETVVDVLLHQDRTDNSGLPLGGIAQVAIWSAGTSNPVTTFSIASNGFTIPSGLSFTSPANLSVGQDVQLTVTPGSLSNSSGQGPSGTWGPPRSISFTASAVALEPSQITGMITNLDSSAQSFTLGGNSGPLFFPWPGASHKTVSFNVLTTSQTAYTGFNPESYDGLADNDFASVSGWLFPPATSGGPPTLAAQSVVMRTPGSF